MLEKYKLIRNDIVKIYSLNPYTIVLEMMKKDYINMHGPEHHFLDGASLLVAYYNASDDYDIESALDKLQERTIQMPGAMCGHWGVCGASASVGAALSVIREVGPLTDNPYYSDNMELTSSIILKQAKIGGPRCCKRNAYLSLSEAVRLLNEKYNVGLIIGDIKCEFSDRNTTCLKERCPFYKG